MSVSSDPDNYGKITVRVLPTDTLTQGPQQAQDTMISSDQVARDQTLWKETTDLRNGNLLTLPVGGGEILYVEPIYSKRKGQESAFPKLLRVLVSYKGQVGYAATVSEALAQVGIDPRAAQDLDEVQDIEKVKQETSKNQEDENQQQAAEVPTPTTATPNEAEAVKGINDALNKVKEARNGSHEDYGKALDELDRAVEEYQKTQQSQQQE